MRHALCPGTDEVCAVGPAPIRWLQRGVALAARPFKKRPLAKLGGNECSAGIYKVVRSDGARLWVLTPLQSAKDECSVSVATRHGAMPARFTLCDSLLVAQIGEAMDLF